MTRRLAAGLVACLLLVVGAAAPAAAHSVGGSGSTNYRTTLTGLTPAPAGVRVSVIEKGSRLELENTGPTEVVVIGYVEEPYLRVGPDGVYENTQSPATYLNSSRKGTAPPAGVTGKGTPQWRKVSSDRIARWHDHRAHWMGDEPPPAAQARPGDYHLISHWSVPMRAGSTEFAATGTLAWVPGPNPLPYYLLAVVVAAGVVLVARRRLTGCLAALTGLLVVVDVVHVAGIAAVNAGGLDRKIGYVFSSSAISVAGWIAGLIAIRWLLAGKDDAVYVMAFAGLSIAMIGGVLDASTLSTSTPPFAPPAWLARVLVASTLGLGLGLFVPALVGVGRAPKRDRPTGDADQPAPATA